MEMLTQLQPIMGVFRLDYQPQKKCTHIKYYCINLYCLHCSGRFDTIHMYCQIVSDASLHLNNYPKHMIEST